MKTFGVESSPTSDLWLLTPDYMLPASFSGGCACGAIRYECTAEPIMMFNCHCRDCQRATGSAFSALVYVPAHAFKITQGTPRYFRTSSQASGHNKRGFCAECGSRLFGSGTEEGQGINASSLDDPISSKPQMHIWTSDAHPGIIWILHCRSLRNIHLPGNAIDS